MQEIRSSSSNSSNLDSLKEVVDDNGVDVSSLSQSQSSRCPYSSSDCNSDNDENQHSQTHTHSTKTSNSTLPTITAISIGDLIKCTTNSNEIHKTENITSIALNANNQVLTGVVVNGFHPQLHTWKEKSYHLNGNGSGNIGKKNSHKRSRESSSLDEKIQEKVSRARNDTVKDVHSIRNARDNGIATAVFIKEEPSILKMYSDMFENSCVPQLITAPGGRIAAWNQEFLKICGAIGQKNTQSLHSLTAFDIVAPTMIPKLYEIFLMALTLDHDNYYYPCESDTDVDVRGGEESDVKYPSLTVPCVNFGTHEQSYYITFSLMLDKNPDKRCFHCIIQKEPKVSIGEIYSVSQKFLMEML